MSDKKEDVVITSLSDEQKAKLPEYVKKWIDIGVNCDPCDFDNAVKWAKKAYEAADLKAPELFFLADSPWHGMAMAYALNEMVAKGTLKGKSQEELTKLVSDESAKLMSKLETLPNISTYLEDLIFGSHDASWLCFYDFFLEEFNLECVLPLKPLIEFSKVAGWWAPYEEFAIIQHRHTEVHFDDRGRAHNENGMAIKYRDGNGIWAINGDRVTEQIVMRPETLDVQDILKTNNAEVKRIMIDRFGWENFLTKVDAKEIDKSFDQDGIALYLLECEDGMGGKIRGVASACTTTARQYFMECSTDCKTVDEAMVYLQGGQKFNIIEQS